MFVISDNGPYDAQGRCTDVGAYGLSVVSAAGHALARAYGIDKHASPQCTELARGLQGISITEPIIAKAARKLGLDQVAIRYINCPEGKAQYGPPVNGKLQHATSALSRKLSSAARSNSTGGKERREIRNESARRCGERACR